MLLLRKADIKTLSSSEPIGLPHRVGFFLFMVLPFCHAIIARPSRNSGSSWSLTRSAGGATFRVGGVSCLLRPGGWCRGPLPGSYPGGNPDMPGAATAMRRNYGVIERRVA